MWDVIQFKCDISSRAQFRADFSPLIFELCFQFFCASRVSDSPSQKRHLSSIVMTFLTRVDRRIGLFCDDKLSDTLQRPWESWFPNHASDVQIVICESTANQVDPGLNVWKLSVFRLMGSYCWRVVFISDPTLLYAVLLGKWRLCWLFISVMLIDDTFWHCGLTNQNTAGTVYLATSIQMSETVGKYLQRTTWTIENGCKYLTVISMSGRCPRNGCACPDVGWEQLWDGFRLAASKLLTLTEW
jgi:hypothetical protein